MTASTSGAGASNGRERPLVAHVIYRLAVGGTENGIVNVINGLPAAAYRHAVIALRDIDAGFASRLTVPDVQLIALDKSAGHGFRLYPRLYRLFRDLRPAIVHTRSLASLEAQLPAWLAGVPSRIHGEHGWDIGDPDGRNRTYRWVRRAYRPFVTQYVAVSRRLVAYLRAVGVPERSIEQIYNGVDLDRYHPPAGGREAIPGCPFGSRGEWLIGTVGRMQPI
jgi:sugar transferase (PEP-CTERM/EpsH1 system associated)